MEYIQQLFFCFNGRLNRLAYFLRSIALLLTASIVDIFLLFISVSDSGSLEPSTVIAAIFLMLQIMFLTSNLSLTVRRLHDINLNGWWAILEFIPYVNIAFWLVLVFKKGSYGHNKYGANPLWREM